MLYSLRHILFILGLILMQSVLFAQTTLVVNEIMANPNNGQLPPYEYIELFNNSSEIIKLEEYKISIGNNAIELPIYRLSPQQFVVLCSGTALSQFESFGNALALSRWPALNNTGATISLVKDDMVIDAVTYSDRWYGSTAKRSGGWSLERINPHIPCNIAANWSASTHPLGGTPGKPNSLVDPYLSPPIYIDQTVMEENRLVLLWNTSLEDIHVDQENFEVVPDIGHPIRLDISPTKDSLYLYFDRNFQQNTLYHLKNKDIRWCGQDIFVEDIPLFRQGDVLYNDVIINEILFNPKVGGVDFVEIRNRSHYPINLQHWKLGTRAITSDLLLIYPDQHLALTTRPEVLCSHYPTKEDQYIHALPSIPAYANQQGSVTLFSPQRLVDSLHYHADMHQPFLKNVKGISLERQSPDRPTNEWGNFRSASTLSGGATPGYINSVQNDLIAKKNKIFLSSKTVSPNQDGFEDFLEINYELNAADYMMNVHIFAESGRLVNRLIRQQSAGSSGQITWDCRTESGELAPAGIYIFAVEIYTEKGTRELQKGGFVVTRQSLTY